MNKNIFVRSCALSLFMASAFMGDVFSMGAFFNMFGKRQHEQDGSSGLPSKRARIDQAGSDLGALRNLPQEECLYGIFSYLGRYNSNVPVSILQNASNLCNFALVNKLAHSLVLNYIEVHIINRLIADNPNIINPDAENVIPCDLVAGMVALNIVECIQRGAERNYVGLLQGSFLQYVFQSNPTPGFCAEQGKLLGAFWERHVGRYTDQYAKQCAMTHHVYSAYDISRFLGRDAESPATLAKIVFVISKLTPRFANLRGFGLINAAFYAGNLQIVALLVAAGVTVEG